MQRQIEYRYWNTKLNKMVYSNEPTDTETDYEKLALFFGGVSYGETTDQVGNMHIMQFSGILDKHGNKVFEGDKVKLFLSGRGKEKDEYSGSIVFKDGAFFIENIYDKQFNYPKCEYLPHNSMLLSQPELYECTGKNYIPNYGEVFSFSENAMYVEVVGNIHQQNP